jgi:transcriptional regulator with XRE-family HTH domain
MTPDELRKAAIGLYGRKGWTAALADALGISRSQVWRYVRGHSKIPVPVELAIASLLGVKK